MPKNFYEVIIVGGGASGVISAIELSRGKNAISGDKILILEKNDRILKKLAVTGNGQANLTNSSITEENFYGDKNFIKSAVQDILDIDIKKYLYGLGLKTVTDEVGRVYPLSKQASSVVDLFLAHLINNKVTIKTSQNVIDVKKKDGVFAVKTNDTEYQSNNVIFSFGGSAGKQFGTDGSSYALLNSFGHKTTNLYPSLVQIKTEREKIRGLKGLKEYALCTAFDGNVPLKSALGDVMFTDYGVSGSAIFQISGHFAKAKNPILNIEFLPDLDVAEIAEILKNADKNSPIYNENAFLGIINKRIGQNVLKTVQNKNYFTLSSALKNFTLKVTGSLGFDNAQVTKGGIHTKDINVNDYQSKLLNGAYIIGEALDVDGDCGGYNLSFAFSSGVKCARAIKND